MQKFPPGEAFCTFQQQTSLNETVELRLLTAPSRRLCRTAPENLIRHEPIEQLVGLLRLTASDILLMQRSHLISGGLVLEPAVDRPRPLTNRRILRAPAGWADIRYFTI
jgi:LysR substrate binding domain